MVGLEVRRSAESSNSRDGLFPNSRKPTGGLDRSIGRIGTGRAPLEAVPSARRLAGQPESENGGPVGRGDCRESLTAVDLAFVRASIPCPALGTGRPDGTGIRPRARRCRGRDRRRWPESTRAGASRVGSLTVRFTRGGGRSRRIANPMRWLAGRPDAGTGRRTCDHVRRTRTPTVGRNPLARRSSRVSPQRARSVQDDARPRPQATAERARASGRDGLRAEAARKQ